MSFFDLFSGSNGRKAALQQYLMSQQTQQAINNALMGSQSQALDAINAGEPLALDALHTGYDTATGQYDAARALYDPYIPQGRAAWDMLGNATGLNGQAGYDTATAAFRASPGYQYRVDQALDGVNRHAAAAGVAASGNTLAALSDRAGHEADQEYGNWYDRVNGLSQTGYDATGKQAAITTGRGDLATGYGQAQAGVYGGDAAARAGIYSNTGTALANSLSNTGQQQMQSAQNAYKAGDEANKNTWNALLGIGKTATDLYGFSQGAKRPSTGGLFG